MCHIHHLFLQCWLECDVRVQWHATYLLFLLFLLLVYQLLVGHLALVHLYRVVSEHSVVTRRIITDLRAAHLLTSVPATEQVRNETQCQQQISVHLAYLIQTVHWSCLESASVSEKMLRTYLRHHYLPLCLPLLFIRLLPCQVSVSDRFPGKIQENFLYCRTCTQICLSPTTCLRRYVHWVGDPFVSTTSMENDRKKDCGEGLSSEVHTGAASA
jgi:hypothetical protein